MISFYHLPSHSKYSLAPAVWALVWNFISKLSPTHLWALPEVPNTTSEREIRHRGELGERTERRSTEQRYTERTNWWEVLREIRVWQEGDDRWSNGKRTVGEILNESTLYSLWLGKTHYDRKRGMHCIRHNCDQMSQMKEEENEIKFRRERRAFHTSNLSFYYSPIQSPLWHR